MRTIKVTFTATGYVSGYPITKKASLAISQTDTDIPTVDGAFVYYDNCGAAVSKVNDRWPFVTDYNGWAPTGGEGFDQSGVTYTGTNASVRNSGKTWAPVGATYATDAPYAYLQAKTDTEFFINNIKIKNGVKNYTFSFTAFNQYASLIASPYTPVVAALESGKNLTVEVSVDGTNYGTVAFTTMPDGNWEYAIAPFTLPADADKLYVRFSNYVADTTTPLPDATYQYQAALRFDDFRLVEGGDGPVVEFNNTVSGGGNTGGEITDATKVTVAEFLAAAEDGTTYYELTGTISNVTNTTYGNFDLSDDTGKVLIYGLSSPTGEQKYWAASGAKAGDVITVRTLRTSYNGTPQGKDARFVSLVPGEGGDEPAPAPAEGAYASDVAFVCATDNSSDAVYGLGTTTIGGQAATGFKLGKSAQQGKFTSKAVGVSGAKYLNFYAVAWKGTTATLYFRVDGGAVQSVALANNAGATGNPPYPITSFAATDHHSVKLEGLTEASTIEFGTNADFTLATHSGKAPDIAPRVIVCGIKLTDEPIDTENPNPTPDPDPTPTPDPTPGLSTDYYLIGYIDGADYGSGAEDWQNLGDYKFVNGKVTVTFNETSYVYVKTGDLSGWFMAKEYVFPNESGASGVLYNTANEPAALEKVGVPAGTATFTLKENSDGTLTLSYSMGGQTTSIEDALAESATIYPNPTTGKAVIASNKEVSNVVVRNLIGKTVASFSSNLLDLSNLAASMYLVEIQFADGESMVQKVIKK
jgi:hypothetical protein